MNTLLFVLGTVVLGVLIGPVYEYVKNNKSRGLSDKAFDRIPKQISDCCVKNGYEVKMHEGEFYVRNNGSWWRVNVFRNSVGTARIVVASYFDWWDDFKDITPDGRRYAAGYALREVWDVCSAFDNSDAEEFSVAMYYDTRDGKDFNTALNYICSRRDAFLREMYGMAQGLPDEYRVGRGKSRAPIGFHANPTPASAESSDAIVAEAKNE